MQQKFGREYSQICRIFNHTVKFVVENHGYRLHDLDFVRSRLPRFNEVIIRKAASFTNDGEVPETISKVSFFLDGTHNRIARPSGNENIQRSVYNGRKKYIRWHIKVYQAQMELYMTYTAQYQAEEMTNTCYVAVILTLACANCKKIIKFST
jgi:hypothetical protein